MAAKGNPSDALSRIKVAKPCPADWREMAGNAQVRHCCHCNLIVYNISEMNRQEATNLIERTEGRLCARYYTRRDGTIITADCPKGSREVSRGLSRMAVLTTSVFGFFWLAAILMASPPTQTYGAFVYQITEYIDKVFGHRPEPTMGDVAAFTPSISSLAIKKTRPVPSATTSNHHS